MVFWCCSNTNNDIMNDSSMNQVSLSAELKSPGKIKSIYPNSDTQ